MEIKLTTKMITLIGEPLDFSFAARMQNKAYEVAGLDMCYFYTEAGNEQLPYILEGVRRMHFAGCAVTKPNKVEVLKYLDEKDELCAKMGACNTIVIDENRRLKGYNTDGMGFLLSLQEETDVRLPESTFFCFGAGGAGRAMMSTIAYYGAKKLYITDMMAQSAKELVDDINQNFAPIAEYVDIQDEKALWEKVALSDVVANATGLGMLATLDATPIPKEALNPRQLCFDATYNPTKTRFLRDAEEIGCRILNGIGMTIYQGAAQIKLWSGQDAPIEEMRREIALILEEL